MLPAIFDCLKGLLSARKIQHLQTILISIYAMTGPVSMRSISRTGRLPYRTLQRFYARTYDWNLLRFVLYKHHVKVPPAAETILVIDEVVEDKGGKATFGLSRFFGGLYQKVVKGIALLQISAVHTDSGKSYPVAVVQVTKNAEDKKRAAAQKAERADLKRRKAEAKAEGKVFEPKKRGRKKGTKNKAKKESQPTDAHGSMLWRHTKALLTILLNLYVKYQLPIPRFLVGDGSFGNQYYVQLSRKMGLHLISKLKKNAVLLWPASAAERQQCKTKPKKYGKRIDVKKIPAKYLVRTYHDKKKGTLTKIYQLKAYNKRVSKELLNIVVIQEVQLASQKTKEVILFSTDLALAAEKLHHYYQLRFVIEIDFRDAKQYFGLRSFKNVKEQQVTNALQIAVTAKLVGQIYSEQIATDTASEPCSILDLKTYIRTHYYVQNIIKYMPQVPKDFLSPRNILKIAENEMIRRKKAA